MGEGEKWDGSLAHFAALTLLLFASLSTFLVANDYPIISVEAGILAAACAGAAALLALAVVLGARVAAALALGCLTAFCIDLMFGLKSSKLLLVLVPVICITLAWILRRRIATILSVTASVLLASTLLLPTRSADGLPQVRDQPKTGSVTAVKSAPVVLHLILDEHIGIAGIPDEIAGGDGFRQWLTAFYVKRGFRLYNDAYSEYFNTQNSIANLLNFSSSTEDGAHMFAGKGEPYLLKDSAYFKRLLADGYRLHVYQSDYMNFCRVPGITYSSCVSYSGHKIGAVYHTSLGTIERAQFIFYSFIGGSYYIRRARAVYEDLRRSLSAMRLPVWENGTSRVGPIPVLPVLDRLESDLRQARRGDAFFAHLLIPHYPYVLDASCSLRGAIEDWLYNAPSVPPGKYANNTEATRAKRYTYYLAQIRCQQTLLDRLFDAMKDAGVWSDAIVIIHGDHGSRIIQNAPVTANAGRLTPADFRDAFSTLFAIKSTGREPDAIRGQRSLQSLLGEALGITVSDSPPKVYLRPVDGAPLKAHVLVGFEGPAVTEGGRHQLTSRQSTRP
jgi:hypothetical protein